MKKLTVNIFVLYILVLSCNTVKTTVNNGTKSTQVPCIENTIESCVCLEVYVPVCGCNNKTYINSCHAECSGVTYTEGACKN